VIACVGIEVSGWELRIDTNALVRSMSVPAKIALGIVCCCGFALTALLVLYAASPWVDHKAIPVFGSRLADTILFRAAALICAFVTTRLIQFRRWAWWTAIAVSLLILGLGNLCLLLSDASKERFRSVGEQSWNWHFIILMTPSFISAFILLLPGVRRTFSAGNVPSRLV